MDPCREAQVLESELFKLLEGTADAAFTVDGEGFLCSWNHTHFHHVNQKLRTRNRLEAVMHALRRGLI